MASKQQTPRRSQNVSSATSQSATRSLIFSNVDFSGNAGQLLTNLRQNYSGIKNIVLLDFPDNDGKLTSAVRIVVASDDLAKQFLDTMKIHIYDKEYSIQSVGRSLVVSKVPSSETEAKLFQDLSHNYLGIEKISRFYDLNGNSVDDIRMDFKSDVSAARIMKDNYILIDGKRRSVQPYWSLVYNRSQNQNGNNHASEQRQSSAPKQSQNSWSKPPQKSSNKNSSMYLTEQRVKELFREQQMQLEAMINEFEKKWNARLSSLTASSTNTNTDQLLPIMEDLKVVCQQFNQQNAQMQRQIGSVVHRVQDVQLNSNNEQEWPQIPLKNGH